MTYECEPLKIDKSDLGNWHQRRDAVHTIAAVLVDRSYGGVAPFLMELTGMFRLYMVTDRRTKVSRDYEAAKENLVRAAIAFDKARAAFKRRVPA